MQTQYANLIRDLEVLRKADPNFEFSGSRVHKYKLNPVLSESDVSDFEFTHEIRLPEEYRQFLLEVGNGGAGPCYGVARLGEFDGVVWDELQGLVGDLKSPFPYIEAWNANKLSEDLSVEEQYQEQDRYWSSGHVNGAMPICDLGCGQRQLLIVCGPESGNIWFDDRADWQGIYPLRTDNGRRVSFLGWYRSWVDRGLSQIR